MKKSQVRRSVHFAMAFALVMSQMLLLAPTTAYAAPTVVVNSTGDGNDQSPGDGSCDTGGVVGAAAECTLRAAIEETNAGPADEVFFSIPPSDPGAAGGVFTIEPATALPWIGQRVTVDGTTQPGHLDKPIVILDGSRAAPAPGGTDGLLIDADRVVVRGLVVRNFADDGIEIHGNRNTVIGNHIFANDDGVLIEGGDRNIVGGTTLGERNVISANRGHGVSIDASDLSEVHGNYIGLDPTGAASASNGGNGVEIWNGTSRTAVGPENVISGNGGDGVRTADTSSRITIVGNRIGTDAAGSTPVPNGGDGIHADTDDISITDNHIGGNGGSGVRLDGQRAVVEGNLIGTDSSGTGPVPNSKHGIYVAPGTNGSSIGGIGAGNVIAFNDAAGVALADSVDARAAIISNSIFSNGGLGIDIPGPTPGPNPNDLGDNDTGPNDLLNHPVITSLEETAGVVYLDFDLDVPSGGYRVEVFRNPTGSDPSGYGEGHELVTSLNVQSTGGASSFSLTFSGAA
ncbi:MAG: right-handed parallel beta-helix repeat-containing protein, partial [Acidimicrobiia bacterium]